jgi:outer membrane lipoprotein-sorting protein
MRNITKLLIAAALVLFCLQALEAQNAQDAQAIIDKADEAFEMDAVYSRSILTVIKNGRAQAPQVMEGYTLDDTGGSARSLTVFREPRRVSGTAYLMLGDDMWVRFASTGRVRKLSSSARKNSAAGSDFSYADMGEGGESFSDDYRPVYDGTEKVDGRSCHRIILEPGGRGADYEKMVVWISEDELRYIRVEYHDKGAPIKVMSLEDYRAVGDLFYPFKVTMTSLTRKSVSVMETESMEYDSAEVEERFFSTSYLESIR